MKMNIHLVLVFLLLAGSCSAATIKWVGPSGSSTSYWFTASNWDLGRLPTITDDVVLATNDTATHNIILGNSSATAFAGSITCSKGIMDLYIQTDQALTIGSGGVQWQSSCQGHFYLYGGSVTCSGCASSWNFNGLLFSFFWNAGSLDVSVPINMNTPGYVSSNLNSQGFPLSSPKYLNARIVSPSGSYMRLQNVATANSSTDGSGLFFGPNAMLQGETWFGGYGLVAPAQGVKFSYVPINGGDTVIFRSSVTGCNVQLFVPMTTTYIADSGVVNSMSIFNIYARVVASAVYTNASVGVLANQRGFGSLTLSSTDSSEYFSFTNSLSVVGGKFTTSGSPTITINSFTCDACVVDTTSGCNSLTANNIYPGSNRTSAEYGINCPVKFIAGGVFAKNITVYSSGVLSTQMFAATLLTMNGGTVIPTLSRATSTADTCEFYSGTVSSGAGRIVLLISFTAVIALGSGPRVIDEIGWGTASGTASQSSYTFQNGGYLCGLTGCPTASPGAYPTASPSPPPGPTPLPPNPQPVSANSQ